ncbi:NADPH-dependent FMN reductase [Caulobacter sp. KR2-114]|uniref:NADPH-dependent FMN reductase n=1 Tax=Caulobacter sp. KR2-114 TaxID=3400912 RepID=UPI003C04D959
MRVLAICGSLRAASSNRAALEAAIALAPQDMRIVLYDGLAELPHFNPDQDDAPPARAQALREAIGGCDGLLISSPEYAHGVAGSFKNALDWLVGSLEFPGTPVALINTSPRASLAQAQMRETLKTMSANIVDAGSIDLPLMGRGLDGAGVAADPALAGALRQALAAFGQAIAASRAAP